MTETEILTWLQNTWLGEVTRSTPWTFAILETIHFMGLCILFGAIGVLDLRVLGFARQIPLGPAMKFIPIAIGGFALNLLTGIAFVCADPFNYWLNGTFQLKMALIVLAGLNAVWFDIAERRKLSALPDSGDADAQAKVIAGLSLALWTGVILLGRLLPYVGSGAG